jgi:hypothetical protein
MIKKAFDANGIKFAFPTVQVAGGSDTTGAVARQGLSWFTRSLPFDGILSPRRGRCVRVTQAPCISGGRIEYAAPIRDRRLVGLRFDQPIQFLMCGTAGWRARPV